AYVFLARGELSVNGQGMKAGDGARLEDESQIRVGAGSGAEVLLFDLP
ncbi:MAG: quercetin 2,3-dioxygenase, partial [Burkholderiaceae bacterium]